MTLTRGSIPALPADQKQKADEPLRGVLEVAMEGSLPAGESCVSAMLPVPEKIPSPCSAATGKTLAACPPERGTRPVGPFYNE